MKKLRGIGIIKNYLQKSEIFTLYIPKEVDYDYRLTVYKLCEEYQYMNERFHKLKANFILFYPREYAIPSNPMYKKLFQFRQQFALVNARRKKL